MIALYFLKTWLKLALAATASGFFEYVLITNPWWRALALAATALVLLGATALLRREYRQQRVSGTYRYQMIHDTNDRR